MKKDTLALLGIFLLFVFALVQLDHLFYRQNDGFCLRTILGQVPDETRWNIDAVMPEEIKQILKQPFCYLAKGHQSYVFASQDGKHVIKFYRFPSNLRHFAWLNHPISYHFSSSRKKIMTYNEKKRNLSYNSYKIAFEELADQTGAEWIHLNRSLIQPETIHLIDKTGNHYDVPLSQLTFVLQKKFQLIFDALEEMKRRQDNPRILQLIKSLFANIDNQCQKGIVDQDPVLDINYGWDGHQVVAIDIGRFVKEDNKILNSKETIEKITPILAQWLQNYNDELFKEYKEILNNTK